MAELMRHQMMSFDNVVDGIAKRYAKLDSIRESKLHQVQHKNKDYQKQVEDLKTKLRMSQNNEKSAKEEVAKLKRQLETAGREIEDQKLKNAQVSKTLASKRLECQNQKEELARVNAERDKFKQDLQKSNSLYGTLENNLREERRTNYLLNRMAKENIVHEMPKPVPPPPSNKRPDSHGRNPFGPVGQIRGPLGSASSTDSSNVGGPVKLKPVVVAVQRAPEDQAQPSRNHNNVEAINEDYLMEYVPEDAVMDSENWDGIREVRVYNTPNMHYLWSRIDACGCETLLVNNHDYHQYCAFETPVHIFMAPFTESNRAITITVDNVRINSFPSKQLELHRLDSSDKTIIKDSNERYEYFYSAESNAPIIEVFNGNTGRRQNRDGTMTNIAGTGQTAIRADGSYCIVENEKMTFKHQWFDLSRSTNKNFGGGFRLAVYESASDRYLQVSVCPEHSVVVVKHVKKVNCQDQKELCTGHHSQCQHLK
uniref:Apoptosis-stimulating of p53 protein 1 n=1 Tax=Panagrellus redivivus TaxID=6233 RepID=A0A7E4V5L7_PANRE